jgi:hypothetical protein
MCRTSSVSSRQHLHIRDSPSARRLLHAPPGSTPEHLSQYPMPSVLPVRHHVHPSSCSFCSFASRSPHCYSALLEAEEPRHQLHYLSTRDVQLPEGLPTAHAHKVLVQHLRTRNSTAHLSLLSTACLASCGTREARFSRQHAARVQKRGCCRSRVPCRDSLSCIVPDTRVTAPHFVSNSAADHGAIYV